MQILIFVSFNVVHQYFLMYYIIVRFTILFSFWLFYLLLSSQSEMKGLFNIMSHINTSWPGVAYNIVWYVIFTTKAFAASISDQRSSLSMLIFCKSNIHTRFYMTWWICYSMEFACGFSVVSHLGLIPYLFLIRELLIP